MSFNSKSFCELLFLFFALCLSVNCRYIESIQEVAEQIPIQVLSFKNKRKTSINLSDYVTFQVESLSSIFHSEIYKINNFESTIDYYNVNVTFIFDLSITNKPYKIPKEDKMKNKTVTSKIKKLTAYMNYNRFHLFLLKDNSYDYDFNLIPNLIDIDFRELNELSVYKSLIQNSISDFKLLFIDIWYDTFNEIISKYPICDTYYYFIETMKLLNSYGIIDVRYAPEPTFLNIQFVSASFSKVKKINNSYEEFEGVLIRLEYYWGEAIQTCCKNVNR